MLQDLRDNAQGLVAKVIIGLIIVIFAVAGIEGLLSGGGETVAAEINGQEVLASELEQAVRAQKRRILESMGENADPALLDDSLLQNAALQQLIQQKLLLQEAISSGIVASPAELDQLILTMPQFQSEGKFSPQLYENVLRNNGYTMTYFKQLLTNDVILRQLSSGIAGSDFVTESELQYASTIIGQKRSYQYVTLPVSAELSAVTVSDEDVDTYFQENISQYQREPKLKLAYIEFKQSDFTQPVEDAQILEAYELEMSDFKAEEERRASHILLDITAQRTEQEARVFAKQLIDKISAGDDFAELAKAHSDDVGSAVVGGDLGYSQGDTFPEAFEKALFALENGQSSGVVVTDAGLHIIKLTDIKGVDKPSFEERRSSIKQRLELEQAELQFVSQVEQLRDLVFNSADLKGPASELDVAVKKSDWLGRSDNVGVLSSSKVLNAAFSEDVLTERNNSEVIELASDHYIVVRVIEYKPAEAMPIAEVSNQIKAKLKQLKAEELVSQKAADLAKKLTEDKVNITSLSMGTLVKEEGVTRISAKANRELVTAIFAMAKPRETSVVTDVLPLRNGDRVIVQLEAVVEGSVSELSAEELTAVRSQLQRAVSVQSLNAYQAAVRDSAEITIR